MSIPSVADIIPILIHVWRKMHNLGGPKDRLQTREFRSVVARVQELNTETLAGSDYLSNPDILGAYLLYHWVLHYQQGLSILGELPKPPKRVLDLCSGGAPFATAALMRGAREVFAVDRSRLALEKGAEIAGHLDHALAVRPADCLKKLPVEGHFDTIILGHCLLELFPEEKQLGEMQRFVHGLLNRLTPDGHLVIVDSSFPNANKRILSLRDACVAQGIAVQAPCVWKGPCPVLHLPNSPCFAQREFEKPFLIKEIQRAASIHANSLKMTYLILKAPGAAWPDIGDEKLYRVISPPVESYLGKRYYVCGVDGKKSLGSRFDVQPKPARAFDYIKRGELIEVNDALEGNNTLDIVEGTQVRVKAACGKPLLEDKKDEWDN